MANYPLLETEVNQDPRARGFSSMNDEQVAADLNTDNIASVDVATKFTARAIMKELGATEAATILDKLEAAASSNSVVKWVMSYVTGDGISLGDDETRSQLDGLASAGAITQAEANTMKALADIQVSWASKNWPGSLTAADIGRVR